MQFHSVPTQIQRERDTEKERRTETERDGESIPNTLNFSDTQKQQDNPEFRQNHHLLCCSEQRGKADDENRTMSTVSELPSSTLLSLTIAFHIHP